MKTLKFIIAVLGLVWSVCGWSQVQSAALNAMAPQHREWRMTGQPDHGYMALVGNASAHAYNSLVHPATWFTEATGAPQLDLDAVFEDLGGSNKLGAGASLTWLQAGWFSGEGATFFDASVSEKVGVHAALPEDLLRLPFTGNAAFGDEAASVIDLGDLDMGLIHYREWRLGVQRRLDEKWSAAARLTFLQGFHHLALPQNDWSLATDALDWSWTVQGGGEAMSSGLQSLYDAQTSGSMDSLVQELPQRLLDGTNSGWGIGGGIEYQWTPRLATWGQFNGGGSIHWKQDVQAYSVQGYSWQFDGIDAAGWVQNPAGIEDSLSAWSESIVGELEDLNAIESNQAGYATKLPHQWVLGSEYTLIRQESGTELSVGGMLVKQSQQPLGWSVALNSRFGNFLESTVTVGSQNGNPWTAGVSLAFPVGPILVFAAAEGHQLFDWTHFTVTDGGQVHEWSMPTNAPFAAAQAGVVWRLGWRKPKAAPDAAPVVPLQNSTRSPALGFDVDIREKRRRTEPCALPGGN